MTANRRTTAPDTTRPVLAPAYYLGRSAIWWIAATAARRRRARPGRAAGLPPAGAVAQSGLDQRGGDPFQDVEGVGPVQPGDVGQHDDGLDAEHQVQRGRQTGPGWLVNAVVCRRDDVVDPPATPGALVARLEIERQAQRGAQPFLVIQGKTGRLAG